MMYFRGENWQLEASQQSHAVTQTEVSLLSFEEVFSREDLIFGREQACKTNHYKGMSTAFYSPYNVTKEPNHEMIPQF